MTEATTTVRARLTDLAFGGEAIARIDGQVVFVPFGLPGEEVELEIVERKKDFCRGHITRIVEPSPERVEAPCPYFGECGGCSLQHASYPAQLAWKRSVVVDQLRRIGHFQHADELILPALGMVDPWAYRNHARFTVGRKFGELCFTHKHSRRLLRIDHCPIMQPEINATLALAQDRLAGFPSHQLAIRQGANTGQQMVSPPVPNVAEIQSDQQTIEEELLGRRFRIAPASFFQVNTRRERRPLPEGLRQPPFPLPEDGLSMAELLALVVFDRLDPRGDELLVDAFAGVGTFGILLAPTVGEVLAIEESPAAVKDARHNARGLTSFEIVEGKTEHVLPALGRQPDAVVLDPARVGCHPAVLEALSIVMPPKIVYVSCDPATLARDLAILVAANYRVESVQPLDMFPQTFHVESVTLLTR
ncbi:MAG: class I SAM-dependent RNA methyltransferase [Chloroflexi bacterium]|nr:class I SAM-dependent RNA methyltransferase [Chloroflexota bacterium]